MHMPGQVISLGQVVVDLALRVPYVPAPGGDVFASDQSMHVGGSYNTLYAVRRMGRPAAWGGALGAGPMAGRIAAELEARDIAHIGVTDPSRDNGTSIALTDASGERTFVSTRGAECFGDAHAFDGVEPTAGDVVHVSGYTFVHPIGDALRAFMRRTPADARAFRAVFDPGPLLGQIDDGDLRLLVDYRPIWSCNEEESAVLAERLACAADDLARRLRAPVIVRRGRKGATITLPDDGVGEDTTRTVPGCPVTAVDTNGAGDCHTGVLCAELLAGAPVADAVRMANAAASIAVTRPGPATCPTRDEALAALAADDARRARAV